MFKYGDKVKRKLPEWKGICAPVLEPYSQFKVTAYFADQQYPTVCFEESGSYQWDAAYFTLVDEEKNDIARPILEERKIGKVRMDLFNEGFPNAVLEIAKVMTWANQNKGYKDHDWKNLPDADKNLPAAAARHGIKQLIQKSKGVPAIDRVDEESKIVHLAHQAFNVLAELELVLTGVIK